MSEKFTDIKIRNLKPQDAAYTLREPGGFTIRVRPSGSKSWIFTYNFLGRRRNMTLGSYPDLCLKDARTKLLEAKVQLANDVDPGAKKQADKNAKRIQIENDLNEPTVKQLAHEYIERHAKPKKRSWKEDQRILDKDIVSRWGNRKAKDVTRRDVNLLLDKISKRGGVMANRTLAVIRKMFNFAVDRGLLDESPATGIKAPAKESSRERVLSDDEIRTLWFGLDNAPMSFDTKVVLKLKLATGQRTKETTLACWSEVDLQSGWWAMPGGKTKNRLPHRIPLNDTAMGLFREMHKIRATSDWVFPSPRKGIDNPITEDSVGRALRRSNFDEIIEPFTPHDLRRTVGTRLGELGYSRIIQDKILNHVDNTVGGIYDRHSYDAEKTQAMEAWDTRLKTILSDSDNVIQLRGNTQYG